MKIIIHMINFVSDFVCEKWHSFINFRNNQDPFTMKAITSIALLALAVYVAVIGEFC